MAFARPVLVMLVLLAAPGLARAQSGPLGQLVPSLGGAVPTAGGVVNTVTGTAGGLVAGLSPALAAQLEQTLAAVPSTGGPVRPGTPPPAGGAGGSGSSPTSPPPSQGADDGEVEPEVLDFVWYGEPTEGAAVDVDGVRPTARVRVLSTLRGARSTGRLKLRVSLDEPGIVALRSAVRPGARRKGVRGPHSRRLLRVPAALLGFRRAGSLTVNVHLGRQARRTLGRSRSARLHVTAVAVDAARNQRPLDRRLRIRR